MLDSRLFSVGSRRLHALVGEAGPPIVMLHGVLRNSRDFAPLFSVLQPRWRIVALDHLGHGESSRGDNYAIADYADGILSLLSENFADGAVLYGHSLGAWTALIAAARLPDLVRGIILEDPPGERVLRNIRQTPFHALFTQMQPLVGHNLPTSEVARRLARIRVPNGSGELVLTLGDLRDAVSLRFSAACLRHVDPAVLPPLIESRWLDGIEVELTLRSVRCPALMLYGDESKGGMLGRDEAKQWTMFMHDAVALHVPSGHLLHWLEREAVVRHLLGFLESLLPVEEGT